MSPIVGTGVMMGLSTVELTLPKSTKKIQKTEGREVLDSITSLHCVCVCVCGVSVCVRCVYVCAVCVCVWCMCVWCVVCVYIYI